MCTCACACAEGKPIIRRPSCRCMCTCAHVQARVHPADPPCTCRPILQEVVLSREPRAVLAFAAAVAEAFPFTSIVPAHFAPLPAATPQMWLDAFRPFGPSGTAYPGALPDGDLAFLRTFEQTLVASGTIRPRPPPGA